MGLRRSAWGGAMPKRLVLCCDGTWNTPDQSSGGQPRPTNVTKLALAIADTDEAGREQCVFYHRGVGTSRWEHISGGAFGVGLSGNVKDTYRFIVENFEPGDELFFFGFSRGAFTARSTAGLVRNAGILRPGNLDQLDAAYALYQPRLVSSGVRRTVGARGTPVEGMDWLNRRWAFHDTDLSTTGDAAYQALAI